MEPTVNITDTTEEDLNFATSFLTDLCVRAHGNAKEKGFLDRPRSWAGTTRLMESELSEALEEYRKNKPLDEVYFVARSAVLGGEFQEKQVEETPKPEGIPIELADFVIRVSQHRGTEGWDLGYSFRYYGDANWRVPSQYDFETFLAEVGLCVSHAYEAHRRFTPSGPRNKACQELGLAVFEAWRFCRKEGIDLFRAIQTKEKYNQTRPYRHGNKRI